MPIKIKLSGSEKKLFRCNKKVFGFSVVTLEVDWKHRRKNKNLVKEKLTCDKQVQHYRAPIRMKKSQGICGC